MAASRTHIIQNATFQVYFERIEEGLGLQEDLSLIFHQKVEPALEQLFDEYSNEDFTIKIDKMELDCGNVGNSDWEKILLNKIKKQVEEILRSEKINGEKPVSKAKSANEVFFYFLEKGCFPWNSIFSDTKELEENILLSESFIAETEYLALNSVDAIKRISSSFSLAFFIKIIEKIVETSESWIKDLAGNFLRSNKINLDFRIEILAILLPLKGDQKHSELMTFWTKLFKSQHLVQNPIFIEELISRIKMEPEMQTSLHKAIKSPIFDSQEKVKVKIILEKILHSKPRLERTPWFRDFMAILIESDHFSNDSSEPISNQIKSILPSVKNHPENKSFEMKRQKNNKEEIFQDSIYIQNAGMVLLHPFLTALFENLNLVKDKAFISINHRNQAIELLEFMVWGENKHSENFFPLNKILCGISPADLWVGEVEIPNSLKNEGEELLAEVIRHWEVLKNTGIDGLRETFLQRPGKLSHNQNGWKLIVEQKTVDILVGSLPWGLGVIKMPWMAEMLFVEWN